MILKIKTPEMATKLELQVKVLQTQIGIDEEKASLIEGAMKSFAVDVLNLAQYLRDKNIEMETARDIMEGYGVTFDGKSKKFK